jgi:hypothetical protein
MSTFESINNFSSCSTRCPVRCSLDAEFDNQVAKQDDVNTELREKNNEMMEIIAKQDEKLSSQEYRLIELEMIIREIGSRP